MSEPHFNGPLARLIRSQFAGYPDPWPAEIDAAVKGEGAVPLCFNCLYPQEEATSSWRCPHCRFPIGEYVPMNPYLQLFLIGEVLRQGVMGPPERRVGVQAFLVVFSLGQYAVFAPIYWFWMIRRAQGKPICTENRREIAFEEPQDT